MLCKFIQNLLVKTGPDPCIDHNRFGSRTAVAPCLNGTDCTAYLLLDLLLELSCCSSRLSAGSYHDTAVTTAVYINRILCCCCLLLLYPGKAVFTGWHCFYYRFWHRLCYRYSLFCDYGIIRNFGDGCCFRFCYSIYTIMSVTALINTRFNSVPFSLVAVIYAIGIFLHYGALGNSLNHLRYRLCQYITSAQVQSSRQKHRRHCIRYFFPIHKISPSLKLLLHT